MNRAAFLLFSLVCLVWMMVCFIIDQPAHAASRNTQSFQREWDNSKVDLKTNSGSVFKETKPIETKQRSFKKAAPAESDVDAEADAKPAKKTKAKRNAKKRGSSTPPDRVKGDDSKQSQRDVCRSQCSLERMSCDQGRDSFQNRTDQLRAAQSSCYLAVQSCISRC